MEASVAEPPLYEVISGLIREGMKPTAAFAYYADRHGKSPGTVATAYYRKARQSDDAPTTTRSRKARVTPKTKTGLDKSKASYANRLIHAMSLVEQGLAELRELMPAAQDADVFNQIKQYIPKG